MHLDNTVSMGNVLMVVVMVGGWVYQVGVVRTELRNLAQRFSEHAALDSTRFDRIDAAAMETRDRADERETKLRDRIHVLANQINLLTLELARRGFPAAPPEAK